jgi:hypothetical protein
MKVSSSSGRIEKFSRRLGTIFLREFKAIFSTVVCELEFKYGVNYTEAFAFKQLAHYMHYEASDVYKQHSLKILDIACEEFLHTFTIKICTHKKPVGSGTTM